MADEVLGTAYVRIVGESAGFKPSIEKALRSVREVAAAEGEKSGRAFAQKFNKTVKDNVKPLKKDMRNLGRDAADAFADGFVKRLDTRLKGAMPVIVRNFEEQFGGQISGSGTNAGEGFSNGVATGIKKNSSKVKAAAVGAAVEAAEAAGDAMASVINKQASDTIRDRIRLENAVARQAALAYRAQMEYEASITERNARKQGLKLGQAFLSGLSSSTRLGMRGLFGAGYTTLITSTNNLTAAQRALKAESIQASRAFGNLWVGGNILLTAVGGLISGLSSLASSAFVLGQALGSAAASGAVLVPTIGALVQGGIAMKIAFSGVGNAIKEGFKDPGSAEFAEALAKLTPAAQDFARGMVDSKNRFTEFRQALQEPFFANFNAAFFTMVDTILPVAQQRLTATSSIMGNLAAQFAGSLTTNVEIFGRAMDMNNAFLEKFVGTAQQVTDGTTFFDNLTGSSLRLYTAMGPLLDRFGDWIVRLSESAAASTDSVAEMMKIEAFFTRAGDRAAAFGEIFGSMWDTILTLTKATGPVIDDMLTYFQEGFAGVASDAEGALASGALSQYFMDAWESTKPLLGLLKDLLGMFVRLGGNKSVGEAFDRLRDAIPPLEKMLSIGADASPMLSDMVVLITEILANLTDSGSMEWMFRTFNAILSVLNAIVGNPVFQQIMLLVAPLLGVAHALSVSALAMGIAQKVLLGSANRLKDVFTLGGKSVNNAAAQAVAPAAAAAAKPSRLGPNYGIDDLGMGGSTGKAKGAAAAASNTAGKFGKLGAVFSKLAPAMSGVTKLLPLLARGLGFLTGPIGMLVMTLLPVLIPLFQKVWNENEKLREVVGKIGEVFKRLTEVIGAILMPVIRALAAMVSFLGGIWVTVVTWIMDKVAVGVDWIKEKWESLGPAISRVVESVKGFFLGLWQGIQSLWDSYGSAAVNFFIEAWEKAKVAISFVISFIKGYYSLLFDALKWAWENIGKPVIDAIVSLWNGLRASISFAAAAISTVFSTVFDVLKVAWEYVGAPIFAVIKAVFGATQIAAQILFSFIKLGWDFLWSAVRAAWDVTGKPVIDIVVFLFNWMKDNLGNIFNQIKTAWDVVLVALRMAWNTYGQPVVDWVRQRFEDLKNSLSSAWDFLKFAWSILLITLRMAWDTYGQPVVDWVRQRFEDLKNSISAAWDFLKFAWSILLITLRMAWDTYGQPVVDWVRQRFEDLKNSLLSAWDFLKNAWTTLLTYLQTAWTIYGQPVVDGFKAAWNTIPAFFQGIKDAVGRIWDTFIEMVKAPIRVVVNGVQTWLVEPLNRMTSAFGMDPIKYDPPAFAEGGPVRGPGGPKDDRILARLSNNEYVQPAKAVNKYGIGFMDSVRKGTYDPTPRGGMFDFIGDVAEKAGDLIGGVTDIVRSGAAAAAGFVFDKAVKPLVSHIEGMGFLGKFAAKVLLKFGDKIKEWGARKDAENSSALSGVAGLIYAWAKAQGLSNAGIAALLGNLQQESGLNPAAVEGNGIGHGILQWSFSRWTDLSRYATARNKVWSDLQLQLDFMLSEINASATYRAMWDRMRRATDAVAAARDFDDTFVRSGVKGNRFTFASDFMTQISAGAGLGGVVYTGPPDGWAYPLGIRTVATTYPGHRGSRDFGAPTGTPIYALTAGVVSRLVNDEWGGGYGRHVYIAHAGGITAVYAHMSQILTQLGAMVRAGQLIGRVGWSGQVIPPGPGGSHLHLEILGLDTLEYLRARGLMLAKGGTVKATPGGVMAFIGEGGRDERVEPLDSQGLSARDRAMMDRMMERSGGTGNVVVKVFIGDREITDIVRTEVAASSETLAHNLSIGRRKRR